RLFGIAKVTSATVPVMELLGGIVIGLFVIYAAWQTITQGKTPGEFTAFITAFILAYAPAERVSKVWVELQKTIVQVGNLYEILDKDPQTQEHEGQSLDDAEPSIRFENVGFSYQEGSDVLKNISFDIRPGEKIAVVGRSGAGKSTLIDLLQRFYDPTSGRVLVGGNDLSQANEASVRRYFALISQDVFLFDGTIRENIRDGNRDASEQRIEKAARYAQLDELADILPDGLDSRVAPGGRALSGGQKQRVGIARALAKDARIFVFDEATSALDSQNEKQIMTALGTALKDATIVFVTHRASTLAYVDRVLVMENGRLAAFDTPDALLTSNPEYKALFEET
ncbi:MAG: ABC transporter ATP-binding protein, partial [Pseudomonadota bacterium]